MNTLALAQAAHQRSGRRELGGSGTYVSIRQHASAYVSIVGGANSEEAAPTSAHVSIRQHTSAYVSIAGGANSEEAAPAQQLRLEAGSPLRRRSCAKKKMQEFFL